MTQVLGHNFCHVNEGALLKCERVRLSLANKNTKKVASNEATLLAVWVLRLNGGQTQNFPVLHTAAIPLDLLGGETFADQTVDAEG